MNFGIGIRIGKNLNEEQKEMINEPYYFQLGDKTPRYYQRIAINRTVDAIAKGKIEFY